MSRIKLLYRIAKAQVFLMSFVGIFLGPVVNSLCFRIYKATNNYKDFENFYIQAEYARHTGRNFIVIPQAPTPAPTTTSNVKHVDFKNKPPKKRK